MHIDNLYQGSQNAGRGPHVARQMSSCGLRKKLRELSSCREEREKLTDNCNFFQI